MSILDILGLTPSDGKGFDEGVNVAAETREIRNSEGVEYSEGDIERIETASKIMGEIFTDEVISNWENLSVEERTACLDEYYAKAGEALGIDTKGVYVEDLYALYGYGTQGVNCGDGYLGIDVRLVADPSKLEDLLNTTTHEMRHQLQNDALRNPDAFPDIPQETLDTWEYEFTHYVDPSYDFEGYESQVIETDARAFAEEVVSEYLSDTKDDSQSTTAHYERDTPTEALADGVRAETEPAEESADQDDVDIVEMQAALDAIINEDTEAVSEMKDKAETTETSEAPDTTSTVVMQGTSCGGGRGCMGSHSCGYGY